MRLQAISYSVASEQAISELLCKQFALNEIQECRFWCQGINDTYKISTISQHYMLRIYRHQWRLFADVEYEVAVLSAISSLALCDYISAPMTESNTLIAELDFPEGKRYAILTPWEEGDKVDISENAVLSNYASTLVQLHQDSRFISAASPRVAITSPQRLTSDYQLIRPYLIEYGLLDTWFTQFIENLSDALARFNATQMKSGFCHGDFVPNNAHYHQGKIKLFDFDCCGEGLQLYDVATFKWYCLTNAIPLSNWERFIDAYQSHIALSDSEVQAIDKLVMLRQIHIMAIHCETAIAKGWLSKEYFDFSLSKLKQWQDGQFAAKQYRY